MIVAVCLNPALDVTYRVDALRPGESHRVDAVERRPGGKGVNVARVLAQVGEPVRLLGLAGGAAGTAIAQGLEAVEHVFVPTAAESRHTVTVVTDDQATVLNEPGPVVTSDEWAALVAAYDDALGDATAVTLSGSLPPGVAVTAYATLIEHARRRDVPVIVDAEGPALVAALAAGPTLAKPNAAEVAGLLGRAVRSTVDARAACRALVDAGAGGAVVSRGVDGLVALLDDRPWTARLPLPVAGNPTGAGDALTAGLARGLARGLPPDVVLTDSTALAAAAVAAPVAGCVVPGLADTLRRDVVVAPDLGALA